jgi:hypothetical protein
MASLHAGWPLLNPRRAPAVAQDSSLFDSVKMPFAALSSSRLVGPFVKAVRPAEGLGFGRIVASEIERPNLSVNMA